MKVLVIHTISRTITVAFSGLFFLIPCITKAQHVEVVKTGDTYKEYVLTTNDSLGIATNYDLLISYENSGTSIQILETSIETVQLAKPPGQQLINQWALKDDSHPLYSIQNPGLHRGKRVASLVIYTSRLSQNNPAQVKTIRKLHFRVPTSSGNQNSSFTRSGNNVLNMNSNIKAEESIFSTGRWIKIPIERSGIYAIDGSYLEDAGLNPSAINPDNVQLWGRSGEPLPRLNSAPREKIVQIPIQITGSGDGNFDNDDQIIFYAKSPHVVKWNASLGQYTHELHPYSEQNFVFLTIDGTGQSERISTLLTSGPVNRVVNTFRDFAWLEEEVHKTEDDLKSGLGWYGQEFNNENAPRNTDPDDQSIWAFKIPDEIFNDTIPGLDLSVPIDIRLQMIGRSTRRMEFDVFANNQFVDDIPVSQIRSYVASEFSSARIGILNRQIQLNTPGEELTIQVQMKNNEISTQGWVDYIELSYDRELIAKNEILAFFSPENGSTGELAQYQLQGFSSEPLVYEVTTPTRPQRLEVSASGNLFSVAGPSSPQRKFIAQARFLTPNPAREIQNQNLRGITSFPDFIIISGDELIDKAREFATYRRSNSNLTTVVATQTQIFNEFSSGVPDVVAIRDYVKFLYDRAENDPDRLPRYLLLFGDTSYDYKGVSTRANQENLVFTFQSKESIFRTATYGSDDFFGLLDDSEGEWRPTTRSERVDIGIGRFPAQTPAGADVLIDKIKRYESSSTFGNWRTLFTFSADDGINGNENDEDLHAFNADGTANAISANESAIKLNKIYEFGFPVQNTSQGRRRPQATEAFIRSINDGTLITNYMGHGDETTLSGERLFNVEQIPELTNRDKLTLMITATCSFGRFDDVVLQSGAERMFLWPNGGSIGAFTTSRVVFTSSNATGGNNFGLNIALSRELVSKDEEGLPRRLGDIYRSTKNTFAGSVFNSRKFILIGDPTMRFGLPSYNTRITSINRQPVVDSTGVFTARALDKVTLQGRVENINRDPLTTFNGIANIQVFDAERFVSLPDLEWVPELCDLPDCGYFVENDVLFKGRASITSGQVEAEFIVPKDISFSDNTGRILIYATGDKRDASGSFERIRFDGINSQALNDDKGPDIDLFLNDETFINGNLVDNSPNLIVELSDESGINTTGLGVGHELIATLSTKPERTFTLNDFFESNLDEFNSGRIEFPLNELPEGMFDLTVQAWDVHNNPSQETISFEVAESQNLELKNIFNYPNPMNNKTEFIFEHNQPGNPMDITIKIFTLSGRPVKYIREQNFISPGNIVRIPWQGRDQDNERIANGTYIYVVEVRADTPNGRQREEKIEKLVIIQ